MLYSLAAINTDILSECIITELEPVQSNQHMAYQGVCMWSIGVAIGYQYYYVNAFGPYYIIINSTKLIMTMLMVLASLFDN